MAKLKIFYGTVHVGGRQRNAMMASTSAAKVAAEADKHSAGLVTVGYIRSHWSCMDIRTGNPRDQLAHSSPETLLVALRSHGEEYVPASKFNPTNTEDPR